MCTSPDDCHPAAISSWPMRATLAVTSPTGGLSATTGRSTGIHQHVRVGPCSDARRAVVLSGKTSRRLCGAAGAPCADLWPQPVGLRRQGFSTDRISVLKRAYDMLFRSGHRISEAAKLAKAEFGDQPDVMTVLGVPGGDEARHLPVGRQRSRG